MSAQLSSRRGSWARAPGRWARGVGEWEAARPAGARLTPGCGHSRPRPRRTRRPRGTPVRVGSPRPDLRIRGAPAAWAASFRICPLPFIFPKVFAELALWGPASAWLSRPRPSGGGKERDPSPSEGTLSHARPAGPPAVTQPPTGQGQCPAWPGDTVLGGLDLLLSPRRGLGLCRSGRGLPRGP